MNIKRRSHWLIPLVSLAAACGPEDRLFLAHEAGHREAAITNGQADPGHPSVGRLLCGYGMCTATLVGQKTVLTAAHCVKYQDPSYYKFKVEGASYAAASVHRHPQYNGSYDIALVILQSSPPIAPSTIATSPPTVGMELTLVGYGVTSYGMNDSGIKRTAKNQIHSMNSVDFAFIGTGGTIGSTCSGDSGGPAFATVGGKEVQVGVTSRGAMPCGTKAIDTRVDVFASWISQTAGGDVSMEGGGSTTPPPPPPPPADTEPPEVVIDSPASGTTIQSSVTVKTSITDNVGVTEARLFVDGILAETKSTKPYDFPLTLTTGSHVLRAVGRDAAGNQGEATVSVTVEALLPQPSPASPQDKGGYGAPCEEPSDCLSGLCAADGSLPGTFCTETCDPNAPNCPGEGGCYPTDTSQYVCGRSIPQPEDSLDGSELIGSCNLAAGTRPGCGLAVLVLILLAGILWRRQALPGPHRR